MGSLTRNPAFRRQAFLLIGVQVVICIAAFVAAGASAAVAAGCAAVASLGLFGAFSFSRYREIKTLAAEIDQVLHVGRAVDLSDCREGDVAVLRNEVGKMTARLSRTAELLEQERNALADALADISHQIRTPLTAIELMIPVIERSPSEEERTRRLHDLERMVDRVSWLVTSLLRLAKIDAGAAHLQNRPVKAARVVESAVEPLAIALDMRGIECAIDADGTETFVGDAAWTTEAVGNIVKNCLEHTPSGGRIAIAVRQDAVACRIRITDTGPGIAEEDLPRIFDRFYRGGDRHTPDVPERASGEELRLGGFGIGLALAQSLVSAQGGTLRASNLDAGGARFDMTFPKLTV